MNNRVYHSIRQTQQNFFPGNIVGCGEESGLGFPDFEKLAAAFGFPYVKAAEHSALPETIRRTIGAPGAALCEIFLDMEQQFAPKLASRRLPDGKIISPPLEDLTPFLEREELKQNMFITEYNTGQK
jgi:acetolactate synthase-1/2/3 large subunit